MSQSRTQPRERFWRRTLPPPPPPTPAQKLKKAWKVTAGIIGAIGTILTLLAFLTPLGALLTGDSSDPVRVGTISTDDYTAQLDLAGGLPKANNAVTIWHGGLDSAGKQWRFRPVPDADPPAYFLLANDNPALALTGTRDGVLTVQQHSPDSPRQQWIFRGRQLLSAGLQQCVIYQESNDPLKLGSCAEPTTYWRFPAKVK